MKKMSLFVISTIVVLALGAYSAEQGSVRIELVSQEKLAPQGPDLPAEITDLGPDLEGWLVRQTDNYIGVKTSPRDGPGMGFRLYDRDHSLLWEKKPPTHTAKEGEDDWDRDFIYEYVAISPNAKALLFFPISEIGHRSHCDLVVKHWLSGYRYIRRIMMDVTGVQPDEENKRLYLAGYMLDDAFEKGPCVACYSFDGDLQWLRPIPWDCSTRALCAADDFKIILAHCQLHHPPANGVLLYDSSGAPVDKVYVPGLAPSSAGISGDGETAILTSADMLQIYRVKPFELLTETQLKFDLDGADSCEETSNIAAAAISPSGDRIAVLHPVREAKTKRTTSRIALLDLHGRLLGAYDLPARRTRPDIFCFTSEDSFRMTVRGEDWRFRLEN